MRLCKKAATAALLTVAGIGAFGIGAATVRGTEPPPPPPWVRADGTIDLGKIPACIEAVGPDGKTIVDTTGKPVCVPSRKLFGPPPPPKNAGNDDIVRPGGGETGEVQEAPPVPLPLP